MTEAVLVNPFRMLLVHEASPSPYGGEIERAVIGCHYVTTPTQEGPARVALEIVIDPAEPWPQAPYYCPRSRLVRQLLAPSLVRLIKPYMAFPPSEYLGFAIDANGHRYSQHFLGENDGEAVIKGPLFGNPPGYGPPVVGGAGDTCEYVYAPQSEPPVIYRVPATSAKDARLKLAQWRATHGWPGPPWNT